MRLKISKYLLVTLFLLIDFLIFSQLQTVNAKDWNGITPLKSSRTDVENLLGKPDEMEGYKVGSQYAYIYYSSGCDDLTNCECLVDKGTVLKISVYIQNEINFDSLGLNLRNFKKTTDGHLLDRFTYSNDKDGIIYTVFKEDNTISNITYLPTKSDCKLIKRLKQK